MTEKKIRITTAVFYRFMTLITLGLILAACNPLVISQETKETDTQTKEITLEPSLEITQTATLNNLQEAIKEASTQQAAYTPTPSATPTPAATPTPEATATPEAITFPSDLVIDEEFRFNRERPMTEYSQDYKTRSWHVFIREQDVHLDETFTLGGGRYHVSAWADAWFMDKEGKGYHISIPLVIFDAETFLVWGYFTMIQDLDCLGELGERGEKIITEYFTGPFSDNPYFDESPRSVNNWCFTENQFRNCGEGNLRPIFMETGYIPIADTVTNSRKWDKIRVYIDFHRELLSDVYTKENVEGWWMDPNLNPRSLQLPNPNLPADFIIPLAIPLSGSLIQ